jgi:hypothetical protein
MKAFPIFIEDSPLLEILQSDMPSPGKMPFNGNNQNTCLVSKPRAGRKSRQLKETQAEVRL